MQSINQKLVSGIQNDRLRDAEIYRGLNERSATFSATLGSRNNSLFNVLLRSFQGLTKRFLT